MRVEGSPVCSAACRRQELTDEGEQFCLVLFVLESVIERLVTFCLGSCHRQQNSARVVSVFADHPNGFVDLPLDLPMPELGNLPAINDVRFHLPAFGFCLSRGRLSVIVVPADLSDGKSV